MRKKTTATVLPDKQSLRLPYPPSWINRLTDWVARLPFPWWLFYTLLSLLIIGGVAVALWLTGVYETTGFHPMQIWMPFLPVYFLFFVDILNRIALAAMQRFRPSFRGSDYEFNEAVYRMTTLPARPVLIVSLVIAPLTVPLSYLEFGVTGSGGLATVPALFISLILLLCVTSFAWMYHIIHQLREIHRLHRDFTTIHLENIRPMHALSRISSSTAIGIILFEYGWYPAQPGLDPFNWVTIGETAVGVVMTLVVFILPLWGAHLKLMAAKEEAQIDVTQRKRVTRARMQKAVESGNLVEVVPLNTALVALEAEAGEVKQIATWPWAPGLLRNTLGAVLLPMVLWMLQFGMQKIFK